MVGNLDNVLLANPDPQPINWSFLTAYSEMEEPQINKVVEFFRPRFVASQEPVYEVKAYYDYDLTEQSVVSGSPGSGDVWDTGVWDTALWGGGKQKFQELKGASGMGRTIAVAMAGSSSEDVTLVDIGIMWRSGGML
jgi:hypothetical protein